MNEKIEVGYREVKNFHVALKNGHTFDFCGSYIKRLVDNHLVITLNGAFIAAFDISEISIAVTMKMFHREDDCRIFESVDELIGNGEVGNDKTEH